MVYAAHADSQFHPACFDRFSSRLFRDAGSIGGVLVILASSAIGFLINGRIASISKKPAAKSRRKPIEASPSTLSPGTAISEAAHNGVAASWPSANRSAIGTGDRPLSPG